MSVPGGDNTGDERPCEHGNEGLVVDLAELAHGGEEDGEHESEHAGARRQCTHQLSAGAR